MTDIVARLRAHDLNTCSDWRDETDCKAWIDLADALLIEAAAEIVSLRRQLDEARNKALEEAASVGYRECAQTRHVRLGDTVAEAIRALKDTQP